MRFAHAPPGRRSTPTLSVIGGSVPEVDPQKTWADYYQRLKDRRLAEAASLWAKFHEAGGSRETIVAVDFIHFSSSKADLEALAAQLSENYAVAVVPRAEDGYWELRGTTRPGGIELSEAQHSGWVEFMADVAQSYACVFSTWQLEAPSMNRVFSSERE
jgi:hypothetical protein